MTLGRVRAAELHLTEPLTARPIQTDCEPASVRPPAQEVVEWLIQQR
jgi:hypothetical protein